MSYQQQLVVSAILPKALSGSRLDFMMSYFCRFGDISEGPFGLSKADRERITSVVSAILPKALSG